MTTSIEYAQMASNAYAVKDDVHSENNAIPIPEGWVKLGDDRIAPSFEEALTLEKIEP